MAHIIVFYLLIGLICSPFIYFNNAEGYRAAPSKWYQAGRAIGHSFYWPSYVFSIEPEVNSKSVNSFQYSIINIVNYRNDKLFTGEKTNEHLRLIGNSIGSCFAVEVANKDADRMSLFDQIFMKSKNLNEKMNYARDAVMKKMDGYDFADIVSEGAKCEEKLNEISVKPKIPNLNDDLIEEKSEALIVVPDLVTDCIQNPEEVLQKAGLKANRISIHGPIDEDGASAGFGCPYRQLPRPGTMVKKNTTVTYRAWWESG